LLQNASSIVAIWLQDWPLSSERWMVETLKLLPGPKKSWLATRELGPTRAIEGEPMYWRCAER